MPTKIFINNLDTFVSRQILAELRGDNVVREEGEEEPEVDDADKPQFFGTYIDKDLTDRIDPNIKKMLKVSL